MKCKRIFKVASALALTVALLVSSAVVSFAATYTTTTTYIDQNTIEVTSTAVGLNKGDMATYVAYNNDGFTEGNAVYIDQATADETGEVEFKYQTDLDDLKATVKFGGSTESAAQDAILGGYNVNIKVDGVDAGTVKVAEVAAEYEGDLAREIPVELDASKVVDKVTVNGAEVAWYVKDKAVVIYSNAIKADGATVEIETAAAKAVTLVLGAVKSEAANTVTAFAKATCGAYANYGILIGGNATLTEEVVSWDAAEDYSKAVKLPALGMSKDGMFCVEVTDEALVAGTEYKVAAYAGEEVTDAKAVTVKVQ